MTIRCKEAHQIKLFISSLIIIGRQFESQRNSAVLVMPNGASIQYLANVDRVKKYLAFHAESFYSFVNDADEGLGRGIRNGELCVIHTCVKSKTFALASIRDENYHATPTSTRLRYRRSDRQQVSSDGGNADSQRLHHGWDISGSAQGKVGPVEADYQGLDVLEGSLENQCLFIGVLSAQVHKSPAAEASQGGDTKLPVSDDGTIPGGSPAVRSGKETLNTGANDDKSSATVGVLTHTSRGMLNM